MSSAAETHLAQLRAGLDSLDLCLPAVRGWGDALATLFRDGGKVLIAGNGGSAALAAHLSGELIGRYLTDRRPLPAVWLGADQAATTAILNDYGPLEVFARQVTGLASPGDVLVLMSTSGRSPNLLHAAAAATQARMQVWALTGPRPNPLADAADRVIAMPGSTPIVQELQQVLVHLVCEELDARLLGDARGQRRPYGVPA